LHLPTYDSQGDNTDQRFRVIPNYFGHLSSQNDDIDKAHVHEYQHVCTLYLPIFLSKCLQAAVNWSPKSTGAGDSGCWSTEALCIHAHSSLYKSN